MVTASSSHDKRATLEPADTRARRLEKECGDAAARTSDLREGEHDSMTCEFDGWVAA
jgi:hypothetical protein